jgi:rubrerythrin
VSRVPRAQEHLKTGFAAEAASAARFRAFAERADKDGKGRLAAEWRALAEAKDRLAIQQLEAAGQIRSEAISIADALSEERYENDVLYPKMMREAGDGKASEVFAGVIAAQKEHADLLARLRSALQASPGDIAPEAAEEATSAVAS